MDKDYKNFVTLEALSAAWLEVSYYTEESYLNLVSEELQGKPRAYRKEYLKQAKKSFKEMQIIMKRLSKVIERDNECFFDESIDKIVKVASEIDFVNNMKK